MQQLLETFSEQFKKELEQFLPSGRRNAWLHTDFADIYVRKSLRMINSSRSRMSDLATINVEEEFQQQGIFKKSVEMMEYEAKDYSYRGVYVESILNPVIIGFLERSGYKNLNPEAKTSPNYYKLLDT